MKTALIIGASSGIGRELVHQLITKRYRLGICARRTDKLLELQDQYTADRINISTIDCTKPGLTNQLELLAQSLGTVDLIINCAGKGEVNEVQDASIELRSVELNVYAFTEIINWAFHYFRYNTRAGHIVNISSVAGIRGNRSSLSYFASKAYQINYFQGLRHLLLAENLDIFCTDIRPGFVATSQATGHLFWVVPVDKAAKQIIRAIEKRKAIAYVSKRWRLVAYLYRILPIWLIRRI